MQKVYERLSNMIYRETPETRGIQRCFICLRYFVCTNIVYCTIVLSVILHPPTHQRVIPADILFADSLPTLVNLTDSTLWLYINGHIFSLHCDCSIRVLGDHSLAFLMYSTDPDLKYICTMDSAASLDCSYICSTHSASLFKQTTTDFDELEVLKINDRCMQGYMKVIVFIDIESLKLCPIEDQLGAPVYHSASWIWSFYIQRYTRHYQKSKV